MSRHTTELIRFIAQAKIKINTKTQIDNDNKIYPKESLLVSANKYGVIFLGSQKQLLMLSISELETIFDNASEEQELLSDKIIYDHTYNDNICFLSISNDQDFIIIGFETYLIIYHISVFCNIKKVS